MGFVVRKFLFTILLALPLSAFATIDLTNVVPHRTCDSTTKCYAPAYVVFNGSAADDSAMSGTNQEFKDLDFHWNFGDTVTGAASSCGSSIASGEGYWACGPTPGTLSKNEARGPIAAHVFNTPGDYTVNLTVRNGTLTATKQFTVKIYDYDGSGATNPGSYTSAQTACVSTGTGQAAGSGGCPAGATIKDSVSNWVTIIQYGTTGTSCGGAICKRVLLKRGDTFSGNQGTSVTSTDFMIGAYGSGAKPIINLTVSGNSSLYFIFDGATVDFKLVDLEFDGQSQAQSMMTAQTGSGIATNFLSLRLHIHHIGAGYAMDNNSNSGAAFVDSVFTNTLGGGTSSGSTANYMGATYLVNLGNYYNDATAGNAEHLVRHPYVHTGVISNNYVGTTDGNKETLSIRGKSGANGNDALSTRFIVVSQNKIATTAYAGIQLVFGGDGSLGERWRDIIIERNYIINAAASQSIRGWGTRVVVRNNIVDTTNTGTAAITGDAAVSSMIAAADWEIYNNTLYTASGTTTGIVLPTGGTGHVVKNNIMYAPNGGGTMISDNATSTTISNNSCNTSGCTTNLGSNWPGFVSAPTVVTTTPSQFYIAEAGNADATGAAVPVYSDFDGCYKGTENPIGAFNAKQSGLVCQVTTTYLPIRLSWLDAANDPFWTLTIGAMR